VERPIKKSSQLVPKMFKTFALYIILTLSVFFGYIQIYGNVSAPSMPTDSTDGETDTSFFGNFVTNLMAFENVDTDISFSIENKDMYLALSGDVQFELASTGLYLNLDLDYREKNSVVGASNVEVQANTSETSDIFKVEVNYTAPNLYIRLDDKFYKFDCESELDLSFLINFISENVKFDETTLTDILSAVGLGDLDVNALVADVMQQLKVEPTPDSQGYYKVPITLKNLITAQLVCDSNYNPVSVRLANNTIIKGNEITFEAKNVKMNNSALDLSFDETAVEIVDMSDVTDY